MDPFVYLILNETVYRSDSQVTSEPVILFQSKQDALDWIQDIAEEYDVEIAPDADSVYLPPPGQHIESDEYYITEMELN